LEKAVITKATPIHSAIPSAIIFQAALISCPWRISTSNRDRKLKQSATVLFPPVAVDINDRCAVRFQRSGSITAGMAAVLIETVPIILQFVVQIVCRPEESLIQ
jgi:hypothetical protein